MEKGNVKTLRYVTTHEPKLSKNSKSRSHLHTCNLESNSVFSVLMLFLASPDDFKATHSISFCFLLFIFYHSEEISFFVISLVADRWKSRQTDLEGWYQAALRDRGGEEGDYCRLRWPRGIEKRRNLGFVNGLQRWRLKSLCLCPFPRLAASLALSLSDL